MATGKGSRDAKKRRVSIKSDKKKSGEVVYQFKITLIDTHPVVWRRIQITDCTLGVFHEHIQWAMGWTNTHLHRFEIGGREYGDPKLMEEQMAGFGMIDSTTTMLSNVLPRNNKRLRIQYEYDFGDSWLHEVLFEGRKEVQADRKYPICLEGERACPPEDVGGVWGYADFLDAIRNKRSERGKEFLAWVGGKFDPSEFDPEQATTDMRES